MKTTKNIIIKTTVLALALITVALMFVSCDNASFNISDYITVGFSGGNGHATPTLIVDTLRIESDYTLNKWQIDRITDRMCEAYDKSPALKSEIKSRTLYMEKIRNMLADCSVADLVSFEFAEDYKNVSNGDVLRVTAVPNEIGKSLVGNDICALEDFLDVYFKECKIKVSGLADSKEIDLFEDIDKFVKYYGTDTNTIMYIDIPKNYEKQIDDLYIVSNGNTNELCVIYDNRPAMVISYSVDSKKSESIRRSSGLSFFSYLGAQGLTAGTSVKIKASVTGSLSSQGYDIKAKETYVKVPSLGHYADGTDDLSSTIVEQLKDVCLETAEKENVNVVPIGYYLAKAKPNVIITTEGKMCFMFVFERKTVTDPSFFETYRKYSRVVLTDIVVKNGELVGYNINYFAFVNCEENTASSHRYGSDSLESFFSDSYKYIEV